MESQNNITNQKAEERPSDDVPEIEADEEMKEEPVREIVIDARNHHKLRVRELKNELKELDQQLRQSKLQENPYGSKTQK